MSFAGFVVELHHHLARAGLAHGFGGALALAYIAEPRGTVDVDVNVFQPLERIDDVLDVLGGLDLRAERERESWVPIAGIRLRREADPYPVDLFPALDDRYGEIERRCVDHPFGPDRVMLPFLSAEDLVVFKLSFARDKDWVDLGAIARSQPGLDLVYVERQLIGLRGPAMHPRLARLRGLIRAAEAQK